MCVHVCVCVLLSAPQIIWFSKESVGMKVNAVSPWVLEHRKNSLQSYWVSSLSQWRTDSHQSRGTHLCRSADFCPSSAPSTVAGVGGHLSIIFRQTLTGHLGLPCSTFQYGQEMSSDGKEALPQRVNSDWMRQGIACEAQDRAVNHGDKPWTTE